MDYYVLDTETTGFSPKTDSLIEIAVIKVRDGEITGRFETFVNPGRPIPAKITELTGIRNEDVADAPDMETAAVELARFISEPFPIVGHNVTFDLRFIQAAFARIGVNRTFRYVDTLAMARKAFPDMPNYKLDTLIDRLGLSDCQQTHRAMDDVIVTHNLLLECAQSFADRKSADSLNRPPSRKEAPENSQPPKKKKTKKNTFKNISPTVDTIDCENPLYGMNVVFTGELLISREEAAQIVVNCGGRVRSGISRFTNYLIVGKRENAYIGKYAESGKEKQANAYNAGGANIQILNQYSFFRMIPVSAIPDADGIAICYTPEDELNERDMENVSIART